MAFTDGQTQTVLNAAGNGLITGVATGVENGAQSGLAAGLNTGNQLLGVETGAMQ